MLKSVRQLWAVEASVPEQQIIARCWEAAMPPHASPSSQRERVGAGRCRCGRHTAEGPRGKQRHCRLQEAGFVLPPSPAAPGSCAGRTLQPPGTPCAVSLSAARGDTHRSTAPRARSRVLRRRLSQPARLVLFTAQIRITQLLKLEVGKINSALRQLFSQSITSVLVTT